MDGHADGATPALVQPFDASGTLLVGLRRSFANFHCKTRLEGRCSILRSALQWRVTPGGSLIGWLD
jgi:hypothetical protein